jgi:hypothetical protein
MTPVETLAAVVAEETARWETSGAVDTTVFGTADPEGIAALVEVFCLARLDAAPEGGHFYRASAGCVLGLRLADGRDVVIKAYQSRWTAPFLTAVQAVQEHAHTNGMPCARPLAEPSPLPGRANLATVESWWPDPGMRADPSPDARRTSAAGLAQQIGVTRTITEPLGALADHPLRQVTDGLYPEPHSPLFDFARTAAGADWIDELARRAAVVRDASDEPAVPGHTDWSARNIRVTGHRLEAVYDWDSVALVPESTTVGQAAATWKVTSEPDAWEFPTLDEITGFLCDYEAAAERRLTDVQWRSAGAAAAYLLAYVSRCEHALDVADRARPDQHGGRDRLADAGTALLALERP